MGNFRVEKLLRIIIIIIIIINLTPAAGARLAA
jgi:hypothetical protein